MKLIHTRILAWAVLVVGSVMGGDVVAAASPVQLLRQRMEQPAEVLVLATPHLDQLEGVTPAHVDSLVAGLSRYAPQAVVLESLPSHTIEAMQQQPDLHPEALDSFVGARFLEFAKESQRLLALDAAGARKALVNECSRDLASTAQASTRCIHLAAAAWDKPWADYLMWEHARRWPGDESDGPLGERPVEPHVAAEEAAGAEAPEHQIGVGQRRAMAPEPGQHCQADRGAQGDPGTLGGEHHADPQLRQVPGDLPVLRQGQT